MPCLEIVYSLPSLSDDRLLSTRQRTENSSRISLMGAGRPFTEIQSSPSRQPMLKIVSPFRAKMAVLKRSVNSFLLVQ